MGRAGFEGLVWRWCVSEVEEMIPHYADVDVLEESVDWDLRT